MKIGKIRINMIEDKSYADKENAYANIGESIQAVVMAYIYQTLGIDKENIVKIDQCGLKGYDGPKVVFPLRLPLSKSTVDSYLPLPDHIKPIFISLHLHDDIFEDREDLVEYFSGYAPIGCRDEQSCSYFRKHGIEAYIMGCYTLCLPRRTSAPRKNKVFLVDVSDELLSTIPQNILADSEKITHAVLFESYPVTHEEDERLERVAEHYLKRYREEAALVITSRLHAAAPCMAMGIPVILASNNIDFRYGWIDKFLPLYQLSDYSKIDWNPTAADTSEVRQIWLDFMKESLKQGSPAREKLILLDEIYRNRVKTQYYKCFRERLQLLYDKYNKEDEFRYAIWGAGFHAIFAWELMQEMFPNAILAAVVDKYKTGKIFGVSIIKENQLDDYHVRHVCITTNPGKAEALRKCKTLFGADYQNCYTILASQQKS